MFRDFAHVYDQSHAPGPVVTTRPSSPVCPECHSSLDRIRRRFVDRLLSLVYPVHRYHCRSFVCNWEGNLRYTPELGRWEALESYSYASGATVYQPEDETDRTMTPNPSFSEPRQRESDTLPGPPTRLPNFRKPDARADPRHATSAPRRAKKRTDPLPR